MEENLEEHLKQFRVGSLPTVFYIPNFVSKSEETHLLQYPHQDGPAYFPIVAILSLGSPAVMNFTPHLKLTECVTHVPDQIDKHCTLSVALMPCSLLIFKDSAYSEYLHGIDDSDIQRIDEVVNIGDILSYKEQMMPLSSELEEGDQRTEKGSIHRSGTRVSLTCRLVPKVHKNLFKF